MYDENRKIALGKGDDYKTGCLLDYRYFKDHYQLVCCNLALQSQLDADPRSIQQIEFTYRLDDDANAQILIVLEKEKQTILEFSRAV